MEKPFGLEKKLFKELRSRPCDRVLMKDFANVLDGVILIAKTSHDPIPGGVEDHAKVIQADALSVLEISERRLQEAVEELIKRSPSALSLSEIAASFPASKDSRKLKVDAYLNALDDFNLSNNRDYQLRNYLRTLDRGVVQPLIGPERKYGLGEVLRHLGASNRIESRASRNHLISRISCHLNDMPRIRDELASSLAMVLDRRGDDRFRK